MINNIYNNNMKKSFGAIPSPKDHRTVKHELLRTMAVTPLLTGGIIYPTQNIGDQYTVGICCAYSLVQNAGMALGKSFSPDFHYLLMKKFIDGNWNEGSAILSSLKVGQKYGFLDINDFPYISPDDRQLPYAQYIAKLQAIPQSEINILLGKCTDKLAGYASVNIDPASIAQAIVQSKSGILCMYQVGDEWYTAKDGTISWQTKDIDPIRPPNPVTSGHAITMSAFNFTGIPITTQANTWGTDWDMQGNCTILFNNYKPRECWIPYYQLTSAQVVELQQTLQQNQITLIGLLQQMVQILKQKLGISG